MMRINERAKAIGRAERALKALGEHPRSSKKELGHAREHLNACYAVKDGDRVWDAVRRGRNHGRPPLRRTAARRARSPAGPHSIRCRSRSAGAEHGAGTDDRNTPNLSLHGTQN